MTETVDQGSNATGAQGHSPGTAPVNLDQFVDAVYGGFSPKNRERTTRDDVARVVAGLRLDEDRPTRRSPRLRIRRLRFTGEKRLRERPGEPIEFDQTFAPGVNIICVPDNEVGKSSILKTIKFCLTGDNSDYDADVRSWITDIWLAFSLDKQEFTVMISTHDGRPHALAVPGQDFRAIETTAEETTGALFDVSGSEAVKDELQRFFFQRLGLGPLSWTQQDSSAPGGVAERSTSWLTYFQALQIPDGGDRYLLCDPQHAMGNQDGLVFSAFLGLHLVEPLNQLGLESARARKEVKVREQLTVEQVEQAKAEVGRLEGELQVVRTRLRELDTALAARRGAVEGGQPAQRLLTLQSALVSMGSEKARLEAEREELNRTIQQRRARERQLREAVTLQLHFTGLEVNLCPNCDSNIDSTAVERELTDHLCRLCGRPAHAADIAGVDALKAEADAVKGEIEDLVRGRTAITTRLGELRGEIDTSAAEMETLHDATQRGIAYALPTAEEGAEWSSLHEQTGGLQAELILAQQRAEPPSHEEESDVELRVRVVDKVRDVLRDEAARRNQNVLEQLSTLTQDVARRIGDESVSDVVCSPLGQIRLQKHGQRVSFAGIQNGGERLRIKLAFFLAMMRLGHELGLGRHPGFLLVDAPGSAEMVREDFEALAEIFYRVDDELPEEVQIICATARPEFNAATAPEKIYGPQRPPYAF